MKVASDMIVAVELGSYAIRAVVGVRTANGKFQVLAVEQEKNEHCIRNGIIDNLVKTSSAISSVVGKLEKRLEVRIRKIYIGLSGQSLHTKTNTIREEFEEKKLINSTIVDSLIESNMQMQYGNSKILKVVPQEYNVGYQKTVDPVGIQSNVLEATFSNVVARSSLLENIERCVRDASLEIAGVLISPVCLADLLLSDEAKRLGCALVDIGSDTTTIVVYSDNIMRKLVVIPIGGSNVSNDIASLGIQFDEAETIKINYGSAFRKDKEEGAKQSIPTCSGRNIDENLVWEIVQARYEEILLNAWSRLEEYNASLLSGIVFTGGGSYISGMEEAFKHYSKFENQVQLYRGIPEKVILPDDVKLDLNDSLYTLIALAFKGEAGCVTEPVPEETPEQIEEQEEKKENENDAVAITGATEQNEQTEKEKEKEKETRPKKETMKSLWNIVKKMLTEEE